MPDVVAPELVVGLVGSIGTHLDDVCAALKRGLDSVSYTARPISVIEQVLRLPQWKSSEPKEVDLRYHHRMNAGDEFRKELKRGDALMLAAMAAIQAERDKHWGGKDEQRPIPRCAFLLNSLKTPEEVETLRRTYGENALVVAAYVPKKARLDDLAARVAASRGDPDTTQYLDNARKLILRDEREHGRKFGQNLRDTFPLADFFLTATTPSEIDVSARRFVELLFGHPVCTPTRDECGMFQAYGAALRSSSPGRQVGASISTTDGEIVSVGTNEVAKAFGGQYWAEDGDDKDHRDHKRHLDTTDAMMRRIIKDLLERFKRVGWLAASKAAEDTKDLLAEVIDTKLLDAFETTPSDDSCLGERAAVVELVEFMRAVHGEMAALMSAVRRGVSVDGCTLYSTSFPCHECARLIVAAGIARVVFIEPYPKSRASEMYDDSIAVDSPGDKCDKSHVPFQAFVGTAPRRYKDFFQMPERKKDGAWIDWDKVRKERQPRVGTAAVAYQQPEIGKVALYNELLRAKNLAPKASNGDTKQ